MVATRNRFWNPRSNMVSEVPLPSTISTLFASAMALVPVVSPLEYGPSRKSTRSSSMSLWVRLPAVSASDSSS